MIRVLLVDDQKIIREKLKLMLALEPDLEIVGTAEDGLDAIEQVEILKPDIVLIDMEMPELDGAGATKIIAQKYANTKVLVLSSHDSEEYLFKSFKAGASGYLVKGTPAPELTEAIRSVYKGYAQLGPGLVKKMMSETASPDWVTVDSTSTEAPAKNAKWSKKLVLPLVAISLTAGFIFLRSPIRPSWLSTSVLSTSQASSDPASLAPENALAVETESLTPVDSYQVARSYTGEIVTNRSSELGFERSGKISRMAVQEGDIVRAGTPIAYLDSSEFEIEKRQLQAERAQAVAKLKQMEAGPRSETIAAAQAKVNEIRNQLQLVRQKLVRRESLYDQGAISQEQLEEISSETSVLQARLEEATSQLDQLRAGTRSEEIEAQQAVIEQIDASLASISLKQDKSILKAPFAGKVAQRNVDEGTVVSAGQGIVRLVEGGELEARVGVPVTVANQLRPGSTQKIEVGRKTYQGRVQSILPELDAKTRTLTAVLNLEGTASNQVSPGQVARLKVSSTVPSSGYWLPTSALTKGVEGLWTAYTLSEPEATTSVSPEDNVYRVEQQEVEVIHTEGDRVLVRGTLEAGDQIIVDGIHRLVPGQLVRPF